MSKKVIKENKERVLLIERPVAKSEFLLEVDGGNNYMERCRKDPDLPIYMVGIIQKGDKPNRNGRIYPFSILKTECDRYMKEDVADGQSYGELEIHAESSTVPELKNAALTIEDIWYKGTEVWGKVKILNAFMPDRASGKIARGIILNGKTLGISSRALGSVYQDGSGYDIVDDDLLLICWDFVSRPSTHDANMRVLEALKLDNNKLLTERVCFGDQCNVCTSKSIITEKKLIGLTPEERVYLNIMGVERFLQKVGK